MPELVPVKSSNIESVGHDADKSELHVRFKNGGTYVFPGITAAQHKNLLAADSIGSHLHKHIKPHSTARKV